MKGMSLTKYSLLKLEFFSWKVTVQISLQRKATRALLRALTS